MCHSLEQESVRRPTLTKPGLGRANVLDHLDSPIGRQSYFGTIQYATFRVQFSEELTRSGRTRVKVGRLSVGKGCPQEESERGGAVGTPHFQHSPLKPPGNALNGSIRIIHTRGIEACGDLGRVGGSPSGGQLTSLGLLHAPREIHR